MYIEHFEDIPKDALKAIREEWDREVETVDDIINGIQEEWNTEETTDSDYIYRHYTSVIGDWEMEVVGSSYRKDQCVCDEELSDGFTLTNLVELKEAKKKEKNAKRAKSDENWRSLFSSIEGSITPEKAFEMFKDYKFPTKWKS